MNIMWRRESPRASCGLSEAAAATPCCTGDESGVIFIFFFSFTSWGVPAGGGETYRVVPQFSRWLRAVPVDSLPIE